MATGAVVSVKDFGAVGDYSTDDTSAIDTAIALASSANSPLYFPHGVYRYTGTLTLPAGIRIIGVGFHQ